MLITVKEDRGKELGKDDIFVAIVEDKDLKNKFVLKHLVWIWLSVSYDMKISKLFFTKKHNFLQPNS